jgi:hypothetical protein
MSDFVFYFKTGWTHIISWDALDHLLFIIALTAIYLVANWKNILVLVTAFTIGHSLTLALSVYDLLRFNEKWVEFLIPCTIIITGIVNFLPKKIKVSPFQTNYLLAILFGLIHGMGFANTIRFMLAKNQNIGIALISFNFGLEVGQIAVVSMVLLTCHCWVNKIGLNRRWWIAALSGFAILIALQMAAERWPL